MNVVLLVVVVCVWCVCVCVFARVLLGGRVVLEPKALKVTLDWLGGENRGAQVSSGSFWIAERVGRHAGVRIVPAERHGRGHGREQR